MPMDFTAELKEKEKKLEEKEKKLEEKEKKLEAQLDAAIAADNQSREHDIRQELHDIRQQLVANRQQLVANQNAQTAEYYKSWWKMSKYPAAIGTSLLSLHPRLLLWNHFYLQWYPYSQLWVKRYAVMYDKITMWNPKSEERVEMKFLDVWNMKESPAAREIMLARVKRDHRAAMLMFGFIAVGLCPYDVFHDGATMIESFLWHGRWLWTTEDSTERAGDGWFSQNETTPALATTSSVHVVSSSVSTSAD